MKEDILGWGKGDRKMGGWGGYTGMGEGRREDGRMGERGRGRKYWDGEERREDGRMGEPDKRGSIVLPCSLIELAIKAVEEEPNENKLFLTIVPRAHYCTAEHISPSMAWRRSSCSV